MPKALKGISPLIAAVLLIAFTMAIAGIMATWATTFSRQRLSIASEKAECVGAMDIDSLSFSNTTVVVKLRNNNPETNLTGLIANIEYEDPLKSQTHSNIVLKNYNVTDPLASGFTSWLIYDTGDGSKPKKITIIASNCLDNPAELLF